MRNITQKELVGYKASTYRGKILKSFPYGCDWGILVCTILLTVIGFWTIGSASMKSSVEDQTTFLTIVVVKQIVFLISSFIAMSWFENKFKISWLNSSKFISCALIMILILVLPLGFTAAGGAKAWIRFGPVSVQPSEFAKIMMILIVAAYLGDAKQNVKHYNKNVWFFFLFYALIIWLLQKDFGSAFVVGLIFFCCYMIPSHKELYKTQKVLSSLFWIGVIGGLFALSPQGWKLVTSLPFKDYQVARFKAAVEPFSDIYGDTMNVSMALIAMARGGWIGSGYSNSISKYSNFPAANTDFIFAIFVEEHGFVGFLVIFSLYLFIVFRMLNYARHIKNEKAKIILVGTAMYVAIHVFFNIGGVSGFVPLTGIPLLLISSGGTSAFAIMTCLGIAQGVIRQYHRGEIV